MTLFRMTQILAIAAMAAASDHPALAATGPGEEPAPPPGIRVALRQAAPASGDAGTPAGSDNDFARPPLSLDDIIGIAVSRSPAVAAAQARAASAGAMVPGAGALPGPMFEVMLQNASFTDFTVGEEEMSMVNVVARQSFPYPGKRRARTDAARAEADAVLSRIEKTRRAVVVDVRRAYAELYALRQERRSLDSGVELLELLGETARSRYAGGEGGQEQVIKVALSSLSIEEKRDDVHARIRAVESEMSRLLDMPELPVMAPAESLPDVVFPALPWGDLAASQAPDVLTAEAELDTARLRRAAAVAESKPDFFGAAGVGIRGDLPPMANVQFGVELPSWSGTKQRSDIEAAGFELKRAEDELRGAVLDARSRAAALEARWMRDDAQIARYRGAMLPQTSAAIDAARTEYLTGRGDFANVVEDFRMWLDARVGLAQREADRFITWAEVQELIALPPPAPSSEVQ